MEAGLWWRQWRGQLGLRTVVGQDWFRPVPVAVADRLCGGTAMVTGRPALSFAGLLRLRKDHRGVPAQAVRLDLSGCR